MLLVVPRHKKVSVALAEDTVSIGDDLQGTNVYYLPSGKVSILSLLF